MAEATIKALDDHKMVLWEKHGCLAVGRDTDEAFDLIDIMVKSASIYLIARSSAGQHESSHANAGKPGGRRLEGLSQEQIKKLRAL